MVGRTFLSVQTLQWTCNGANSFEKLSGIIEVDETYIGGKHRGKRGRGSENKIPVVAIVQRNGTVRSCKIDNLTAQNLKKYIKENVRKRLYNND